MWPGDSTGVQRDVNVSSGRLGQAQWVGARARGLRGRTGTMWPGDRIGVQCDVTMSSGRSGRAQWVGARVRGLPGRIE